MRSYRFCVAVMMDPEVRKDITDRFTPLPLLTPDRLDHIHAAELRNRCRRAGLQIGTIEAVIAQLCIRHGLTLLMADDNDFVLAARHVLMSSACRRLAVGATTTALPVPSDCRQSTLSGRSLLPKLPFNRVLNATGERSGRAGSKGTH